VAEAGVGKSRLVYEFANAAREPGWLIVQTAGVSYEKGTTYFPVIELLKSYFAIEDRDDLCAMDDKVTRGLLTLDPALSVARPALCALLDIPVDDTSWPALDPSDRRQRTLDAVKRVLLRQAREQPLIVIMEDLHWIDSETQAVLDG